MDKQKIIAGVNPKKRKPNRKDAVAKIREQSFNEAYQKKQEEEEKTSQKEDQQVLTKNQPDEEAARQTTVATDSDEAKAGATPQTNGIETVDESATEKSIASKSSVKRKSTKAKKKDGGGDITYATISVHQNVSKVVKLASTMLEANKLDFTTDAVRHYIKYLKKSGKLPDMSSLDL